MGRHSTTRQASASASSPSCSSRPRLGARLLGNYCPCRRRRCCCPFRRRAANGITSAFALSLKLRKLSINMRGQASINPPPLHPWASHTPSHRTPPQHGKFLARLIFMLHVVQFCVFSLALSLSVRLHGKPEASLS